MLAVAQAAADRTAHGDHRTTISPPPPKQPPCIPRATVTGSRLSSNDERHHLNSAAAGTGKLSIDWPSFASAEPNRSPPPSCVPPSLPNVAPLHARGSCNLWTERHAGGRVGSGSIGRNRAGGFRTWLLGVLSRLAFSGRFFHCSLSPQMMPLGHSQSTDDAPRPLTAHR